MIIELNKFLSKNKTTLLILFISILILMVVPAVILKHFFHQDLKNWQVLLTPLVTIVLYISGLNKFDDWLKNKKREKAFETIEKTVDQHNRLKRKIYIMLNITKKYSLTSTKSIILENRSIREKLIKKLDKLNHEFSMLYQEVIDNYNLLQLWGVEITNNSNREKELKSLVELSSKIRALAEYHCGNVKVLNRILKLKKDYDTAYKDFCGISKEVDEENFEEVFTIK